MKKDDLRVSLKNFRAINSANIILNGISVVAGINGSGKSTISKLLYCIFKTINNFNLVVINKNTRKINQFREIYLLVLEGLMYSDHLSYSEVRKTRSQIYNYFSIPDNFYEINISDLLNNIQNAINLIQSLKTNTNLFKTNESRIISIIKNEVTSIDYKYKEHFSDVHDFEAILNILFDITISYMKNTFNKMLDEFESKPRKYLDDIIKSMFKVDFLPKELDIYEFETKLTSYDDRKITPSYLIKNVLYIDTPMAFKSRNSNYEYWDDLNFILDSKDINNNYKDIADEIEKNILGAQINIENLSFYKQFVYQRLDDDFKLDFESCATGIKSLGIIYLLLKNGSINEKTLLILDEPEAHLHPQWIVEYARILVLLRKKFGCNMFISSHSPDFVQAIKAISEKENMINDINFYLAKEVGQHKFDYVNLDSSIADIFKCFNKSIEKIESYSEGLE
ncbi:AAA family ATPase [Haemophilus haemolyticus]|uniref:AAA family ATPase n=1 Tax=Haemophilus haemolyticus TaxID=726 RepID=UPI000E5717A6|nr:AAA family ATPase [Haemophilus haemolyticus]